MGDEDKAAGQAAAQAIDDGVAKAFGQRQYVSPGPIFGYPWYFWVGLYFAYKYLKPKH